jgi:hypothetical protein
MPRGRKPNLDRKIHELIGQLKAALVARARLRIEAQVDARVATLVEGLQKVVEGGGDRRVAAAAATPGVRGKPAKRRLGWSPAARAAAKRRMQAYWAARKARGKK